MNKIFNFLFFTAFYFGSIFASNIEFEADKTSFDTENELLLLEGNVSLKIENLLFKADQVSLDNKNKVFGSDYNRISIITKNKIKKFKKMTKINCAKQIIKQIYNTI